MFGDFVLFAKNIWPIYLLGGAVISIWTFITRKVKKKVQEEMRTKVDKEVFEKFKRKNEEDHSEMQSTLSNIEGKIDVLLNLNGGGKDA